MIDLIGSPFEEKVSTPELQGKANFSQYKYSPEVLFFDSIQQRSNAFYILSWVICIH